MTNNARSRHVPATHWIVAAIGAVVVLATVVFLLNDAIRAEHTPPAFEIRTDSVTATSSGYLAHITVRNTGGITAASVTVRGDLMNGTATLEAAEVTFDFIPRQSYVTGGLFFTRDPAAHALKLRALGFERP